MSEKCLVERAGDFLPIHATQEVIETITLELDKVLANAHIRARQRT
jgi:hypothetical protein